MPFWYSNRLGWNWAGAGTQAAHACCWKGNMLFTCFHFHLPRVALGGGKKVLVRETYYKVSCCTCVRFTCLPKQNGKHYFSQSPMVAIFLCCFVSFLKSVLTCREVGFLSKHRKGNLVLYFRVLLKATHKARRMFRKQGCERTNPKIKPALIRNIIPKFTINR